MTPFITSSLAIALASASSEPRLGEGVAMTNISGDGSEFPRASEVRGTSSALSELAECAATLRRRHNGLRLHRVHGLSNERSNEFMKLIRQRIYRCATIYVFLIT